MSSDNLPDGWTRVKFGDVVRKVNDRVDPETSGLERYVAGEHMDTDDLRIRRWGEIGEGYLGPAFHMRFQPGQVLYGSRRTYLRKVAMADFEGITANTTFVLESSSDSLLPEFLPFVMTTEAFHGHSIKQSKGSVNPYINFTDLTWYEFALPPINEQHRIVDLVGAVDRVAEGLRAVDIKALWRAVLRQALEQTTVECPLGEVLSLEYGKGLSEKNRDGGAYQVVGSSGIVGSHSIPLIAEDSVIVVGRKGTAGSVQLISGPCWPIDTTYYVKLKAELPLVFVAAQLSEIGLDALVAGSAVPGLNRDDAYQLRFRLPDPASIARLVSALARLEAASERVMAERERVRLVRLAMLNVLMEGKDV